MNFKTYGRLNNIIGWVVFAIAAIVYLSTMERTVSLWDCGEFVSSAYKLQVPHPPGAPFFLLVYRFFAMLAPTPADVPIMTNGASALCSAFTILFLFWTITSMAQRLILKDTENLSKENVYGVFAAGIIGGLAYTFSDTFWFSAVESEVYAMSSMFTALVFWLVLKWERRADQPYSMRWIVLIFFLVGVVIGVHLLGLLVIPVVVLIYYFKKYKNITPRGTVIAIVIGLVSLALVQFFTILTLPSIASKFDLTFVNSFGLPLWSGVIFFFVLLIALLVGGIIWSQRKGKFYLNVGLSCYLAVILGYTCYTTSVIRSLANPTIDMNDPENVFSYNSYLSREQYGDNYLLSGPNYTAFLQNNIQSGSVNVKEGKMNYDYDGKKFVPVGRKRYYEFSKEFKQFLPRMFSQDQDKFQGYRFWGWSDSEKAKADEESNNISLGNNMRFMMTYQMNYMYFRYFAWNFIGRQNDLQGIFNEPYQGRWISGITFIDSIINGADQSDLPESLENNKARNKLFFLPFLLGILGMIWQYKKSPKDFLIVGLFFFMTGIAIELYLNMPSPQPRERDYAFVGSFYVFAIWIGFGVFFLIDALTKSLKKLAVPVVFVGTLLAVPVLMASQEWDDHDRSNRTASLDYGVNYLESCPKNAVLFTNGDNDTYPLWYAQEVEGIRDDVRIVNLSLFGIDWYVNQMRRPVNNAIGVPFSLTEDDTKSWEIMYFRDADQNSTITIMEQIDHIKTTKSSPDGPSMLAKNYVIPIEEVDLKKNNITIPEGMIADNQLMAKIKGGNMTKSDYLVLDFIYTNHWKNPVCFSATSGPDNYLGLGPNLRRTGLVYTLVPYHSPDNEELAPDDDIMFTNITQKWRWGKLDVNESYVDYVLMRSAQTNRNVLQAFSLNLAQKGEVEKALKIAELAEKKLPYNNVPIDNSCAGFVYTYYAANKIDLAKAKSREFAKVYMEDLTFFVRDGKPQMNYELYQSWQGMELLWAMAKDNGDAEFLKMYDVKFRELSIQFGLDQEMLKMYNQQHQADSYRKAMNPDRTSTSK